MHYSPNDLEVLLDSKNVEERSFVDTSLLIEDSIKSVDSALNDVARLFDLLVVEARIRSDGFWRIKEAMSEDPDEEVSYLGTRIRITDGYFSAVWYRNHFALRSKGKNRMLSKHIKKGRNSDRYDLRFCENEPVWAKEAVKVVEDEYEKLRKRARVLSTARRTLLKIKEQLEEEKE